MANILALSPQFNRTTFECLCVIETPKNSRRKYKLDEPSGLFKLAHMLPEGMSFPFDFGFIPSTRASDGDPIDVMVLADEPAAVGTLMEIRLIGVIEATQVEDGEREENDRLLAIPVHSQNNQGISTIKDVPRFVIDQLENFFVSYTRMQGKKFRVKGWSGPRNAAMRVTRAMKKFKKD